MKSPTQEKVSTKTIGLVALVVVALALAAWQGTKAVSGAGSDVSYTPKVKPPPESARPPGFEAAPSAAGADKTSAGD